MAPHGRNDAVFPKAAAEAAYREILSLPIFPAMSDGDADDVVAAVAKVAAAFGA